MEEAAEEQGTEEVAEEQGTESDHEGVCATCGLREPDTARTH